MKDLIAFVIFLSATFCARALAGDDFTYRRNPIDPICIERLRTNGYFTGQVSLKECTGTAANYSNSPPQGGLQTFEDGSIGYAFKCRSECERDPFISYRHLGLVNGQHILKVEFSGDGLELVSGVLSVALEGDRLSAAGFIGGNQCRRGITDVFLKDGIIFHTHRITPFDLIELSGGNRAGFEASEVQSCQTCCIGEADFEDQAPVLARLTPEVGSPDGLSPADACFFDVYRDITVEKGTNLDAAGLGAFGDAFNTWCGHLKQ